MMLSSVVLPQPDGPEQRVGAALAPDMMSASARSSRIGVPPP